MLPLNSCRRICVVIALTCCFPLPFANAQTATGELDCDAEYDKLYRQHSEALAALGPVALKTTWSFKKLRETLGPPNEMGRIPRSNQFGTGWFKGPPAGRAGVGMCKEYKDKTYIWKSQAVYAVFVSDTGEVTDAARPQYFAINQPFSGTVDGLRLGLPVSAFRAEVAKRGWAASGSQAYRSGVWELSWSEVDGTVARIQLTDKSYVRRPY